MKTLRNEAEIIGSWESDPASPVVSICCIAYNHETYLESTFRGFLEQQTSFPIEILVHDDASTDRSGLIIEDYAARYPAIVKPIIQVENQYSKQIPINQTFNFPRARGRYVALCEGDDFWTDPLKLSKQVRALSENPECDICLHSAVKLCVETGEEEVVGRYLEGSGVVSAADVIEKRKGIFPTASTLVKIESLRRFVDFAKVNSYIRVGDIYIHIFGSLAGGAYYLDEQMSLYRWRVPGSWTERASIDTDHAMEALCARIRSFESLCDFTGGAFRKSFVGTNQRLIKSAVFGEKFSPQQKRQIVESGKRSVHFLWRIVLCKLCGSPRMLSIASHFVRAAKASFVGRIVGR